MYIMKHSIKPRHFSSTVRLVAFQRFLPFSPITLPKTHFIIPWFDLICWQIHGWIYHVAITMGFVLRSFKPRARVVGFPKQNNDIDGLTTF